MKKCQRVRLRQRDVLVDSYEVTESVDVGKSMLWAGEREYEEPDKSTDVREHCQVSLRATMCKQCLRKSVCAPFLLFYRDYR